MEALLYLGICKCPDQPLDTETAGMWIREVIALDTRYPEVPRTSRYDERRGGCVEVVNWRQPVSPEFLQQFALQLEWCMQCEVREQHVGCPMVVVASR